MEAEEAASNYLEGYPDDPDVLASKQRLDEKAAELRDPERALDRLEGKLFLVVAFILTVGVSIALSLVGRGVVEAVLIGLLVALLVSWETSVVLAGAWTEFGSKALRILGYRSRR